MRQGATVRYRNAIGVTRANATFIIAFFGSFVAINITHPEPGVVSLWLIVSTVWAIAIRWWIVVGVFAGLLFGPRPGLVAGIGAIIAPAVLGGAVGFMVELIWWLSKLNPPDHSNQHNSHPPALPSA